jgi:hypothetical protein
LNIPNQFTVLFTEELPLFRDQHGIIGHVLGGWSFSGNYIIASGQGYTPSQAVFATLGAPDFFDRRFNAAFIGAETARPFLGSMSAPATSAGIFAADACNLFGACVTAGTNPNQLLSLNQLNTTGNEVTVTNSQVRFIVNAATAEQVFGTPFGNTARNIVTDAITNTMNFAVSKRVKFNERSSFEFRMTMLNALNHQNFGANGTSIDPFIEDAGLVSAGTGFGDVSVQNTSYPGSNNSTRRITFGGTFRF